MTPTDTAEDRATGLLVRRAFERLTGRSGEPVRYALMDGTPVGILGLAAGPAGLRRLEYVDGEDAFLTRLLAAFPDQPLERSNTLDAVRRELERYFAGRRFTFETRVDLSSPRRPAGRAPRGPPATHCTTIPWRSSCPATASCAATARWAVTRAVCRPRSGC